MKKLLGGLCIFVSCMSLSCLHDKGQAGLWMFLSQKGDVPAFFKTPSDTAEMLISGSFINLQTNGNFTARFFSRYFEGDWSKTDSFLTLITSKQDTLRFETRVADPDSLILKLVSVNSSKLLTYTIGGVLNTIQYKEEDNPYSKENNVWALKPDKKENAVEIRQRVLNYINYLRLVLNDPYNNSDYLELIDNPIRIATNGLSLKWIEEVDAAYKMTYYDEEDFKIGYAMLNGAFRCRLDVMDTDDMVLLDTDLLKQIYKIIKEVRERK